MSSFQQKSVDVTNLSGPSTAVSVLASEDTYITGANVDGEAVGYYQDSTSSQNTFIDQGGTLTALSIPGSRQTDVDGLTATGDAYGDYYDASGEHGFVDDNGAITSYDVPTAVGTSVTGIDSGGDVVGTYFISGSTTAGFIDHQGTYTTVAVAGATSTSIAGVTPAGVSYGSYVDPAGQFGFTDTNGTITTVNVTGSAYERVTGVDAAGDVFGTYQDATNHEHGFIDKGGTITTIDVTGATATSIEGADAAGDAFGTYYTNSVSHSFVDDASGTIKTIDPAGATSSYIIGVDSFGDAYGADQDATGEHGFVIPASGTPRTPASGTPELINGQSYTDVDLGGIADGGIAFGSYSDSAGTYGLIDQNGTITTIVDPQSPLSTSVNGVDAAGDLVGQYFDGSNFQAFFDQGGTFEAVSVTGATSTRLNGIDAAGVAYGSVYTQGGGTQGLIDDNGTISTIEAFGPDYTDVTGVDAAGDIFGTYAFGDGDEGFVDHAGTFTTIEPAGSIGTHLTGVSAAGAAFGSFEDAADTTHGFVYTNGVIQTVDAPDAEYTVATGVDAAGDVVGYYVSNANDDEFGFVDKGGVFTTIAGPQGTNSQIETELTGINAAGQLVGNYVDDKGGHDFVGNIPAMPTIAGTKSGQTTAAEAPIAPFSSATISDSDVGATDSLTITLSGGGGTLADGQGHTGLTQIGADTYSLATDTAANVTAELDALVFTPTAGAPGTSSTTTFTLADTSSAFPVAVTDAATSVIDTAAPTPPAPIPTPTPSPTPNPAPTPTPAPVSAAVSIDPNAAFIGHGTFVLTGTASSPAGVSAVEISATVDGVATDLGTATVSNGTFRYVDKVGPNVQGFITATETDGAGGSAGTTADFSLQAGTEGQDYVARQDTYAPDGMSITSTAYEDNDGSRTVAVEAFGQTLTSQFDDTFANGGQGGTTFVFTPGYVKDTITEFRPGGPGHDTIALPSSDFTSFADVLRHTQATSAGAVIHDPTSGDALLIAGLSKPEMQRYGNDFTFHA